MPVIRSTISGVYREYCCLSSWNTHRGCCSDKSYATLAGNAGGGAAVPPGFAPAPPALPPAGPCAAYPRPVNASDDFEVGGAPLGGTGRAVDVADSPPPLAVPRGAAAACCAVTRPPAS